MADQSEPTTNLSKSSSTEAGNGEKGEESNQGIWDLATSTQGTNNTESSSSKKKKKKKKKKAQASSSVKEEDDEGQEGEDDGDEVGGEVPDDANVEQLEENGDLVKEDLAADKGETVFEDLKDAVHADEDKREAGLEAEIQEDVQSAPTDATEVALPESSPKINTTSKAQEEPKESQEFSKEITNAEPTPSAIEPQGAAQISDQPNSPGPIPIADTTSSGHEEQPYAKASFSFSTDQTSDDPFDTITSSADRSDSHPPAPGPQSVDEEQINDAGGHSHPARLDNLFGDGDDSTDAFAQLDQSVQPEVTEGLAEPAQVEQEATPQKEELPKAQEPSGIGNLQAMFGDDDASTDLFAQLGQPETPSQPLPEPTPVESNTSSAQPVKLDSLFSDDAGSGDPFAQLGAGNAQATSDPFATIQPANEGVPALDEKDFSDLLAEFEDEFAEGEGDLSNTGLSTSAPAVTSQSVQSAATVNAAALFADGSDSSAFDDIFAKTSARQDPESPVPNLSIENSQAGSPSRNQADTSIQSMFSNASDWLGDTSVDESLKPKTASGAGEGKGQAADEPLPFDIPQGWYNDAGEWVWYTEEEKELVRLTMLDQGELAQGGLGESSAVTGMYSPGPGAGQSENAARRTPQPEAVSRMPDQNPYNPYAPPQVVTPAQPSPYAPSSAATSSVVSPYAAQWTGTTSTQPSPYAAGPASTSSYDPYAPSTSSQAAGPYGAMPKPYGSSALPPVSRQQPKDVPRPEPPKRVVSNAYDPPFLRPQKSFIRPASAVGQTPVSFTASAPATPPQPAPPAPPPSGPPRRPKTPSASSAPAYAPPPPRIPTPTFKAPAPPAPVEEVPPVPPLPGKTAASQPAVEDPYAAPNPYARPTPAAAAPAVPPQAKPSPRAPSYNAFDPPLRPTSAARARPVAPPERTVTPPIAALAPPTASTAPPAGPPRGPSRGSVRKPSPMFEARPSMDRPPSRTSTAASVHGRSPLVVAAPIPSESETRAHQSSKHPAAQSAQSVHSSPPSVPAAQELGGEGEGYDPEAGDEIEGGEIESVEKVTLSAPRPPQSIRNEYNPYESKPSEDSIEQPAFERQLPQSSGPYDTDFASRASHGDQREVDEAYNPYSSGAEPREQPRRPSSTTPRQEISAPSYEPSPYQPTSQPSHSAYAPSGYEPPERTEQHQRSQLPQQSSQYQPPQLSQQDSYGLGLQTMGSPPSQPQAIYNPYAPSHGGPGSQGYTPYAPSQSSYQPAEYQPQSAQPSYSGPADSYDPYGPSSQSSRSNPSDPYARPALSSSFDSNRAVTAPQPSYFQAMPPADPTYVPQQVLEQKPISEDPLGRSTLAARNAPLAVFGFGGVLITGFPGSAESDLNFESRHHRKPSYGYASGRGQLWIRTVSDLASTSALKPNDNIFPGPLVHDPSTPKGAAGEKKKREAVIAYLQARAEEIEKGLPYLKTSAHQAKREEEGKLVLLRLLNALVLGDGKLSGKPEVEEAVRNALGNDPSSTGASSFTTASSMTPMKGQSNYSSTEATSSVRARPHDLKELGDLMSRGEKREAAQYAARRGLWSHALLISSSADPELWSEIVMRFSEAELGGQANTAALKASYAVFANRTSASVDDLVNAADLAGETSSDSWREVIAAVVFNGKPSDFACLDELGVRLRKAGLNYPAHVCHLLSSSSAFSDFTPGAYARSIALTNNAHDDDALVFAEIAEYARSLVSLPKGQELPFPGLPQLLPYKLQRAWHAAELGDIEQAKRYCTAIESASKPTKTTPSVLQPALLASLEDLTERLTGTPSANPARSFGGRKAKSGAGLGSWIEGRLTKFIAGEEGDSSNPKPAAPTSKDAKSDTPIGPFSHFSTISPAVSGPISRNPSMPDFGGRLSAGSQHASPLVQRLPEISHEESSEGHDPHRGGSTWGSWSASQEAPKEEDDTQESYGDDEGDFINPMAAVSVEISKASVSSDYQPPSKAAANDFDDDDDDLGFGNSSLSRGRTPKPPAEPSKADGKKKETAQPAKEEKKAETAPEPPKVKQKGSWLGGWFGKKDGEGSGPVRAKLGEESSMVFDKELGRWVVKGTKPEPAPAAPPPPPRAQTASPSHSQRPDTGARAMSATPPASQAGKPPGGTWPRTSAPPPGFTEMSDGQIRRNKSTLNESITADETMSPPTSAAPPSGPPGGGPPSGPPRPVSKPPGASIDDLLSRPPSKRPGSGARKPMKNRYVDVFQPESS